MKTTTMFTTLTLTAALTFAGAASAQNGPANDGSGNGTPGGGATAACQQALLDHLALLPIGDLDADEAAAVTYLREEEKLARDVYVTLSLSWDLPVFSQIARSEQQHMDLVALLIDRYELIDPIVDDEIGAFTNPELGALYAQLVAAGRQSLLDGLVVGATIEDLDLADLGDRLLASNDLDVDLIGENLAAGSRNHLRAFVGAISTNGGGYVPQFMDSADFAEIVASDPERGVVYDEFGEILAECGGSGGSGGQGGGGGQGGNGGQGSGDGTGTGTCDGTGRG
jgi:hypothetical protein